MLFFSTHTFCSFIQSRKIKHKKEKSVNENRNIWISEDWNDDDNDDDDFEVNDDFEEKSVIEDETDDPYEDEDRTLESLVEIIRTFEIFI